MGNRDFMAGEAIPIACCSGADRSPGNQAERAGGGRFQSGNLYSE
jgi:hypothetical protein